MSDNQVLQPGLQGDWVEYLQRLLQRWGFDIGVEGVDKIFGPHTENAVKKFQLDRDLQPTGVVDSRTWDELENAGQSAPTTPDTQMNVLKRGDTSDLVGYLQTMLHETGFNIGPSGIDKKFGPDTEAAVKHFQDDHSLPSNGIVDGYTWAALEGHHRNRKVDTSPTTPEVTPAKPLDDRTAPKSPEAIEAESKFYEYMKESLVDGTHTISTVSEVMAWFQEGAGVEESLLISFAEWMGPIGEIIGVATVLYAVYDSFSQGIDQKKRQGFCFGVMWAALDRQNEDLSFEPWWNDSAQELHDAFYEGVADGRSFVAEDVKHRNGVLAAIAYFEAYAKMSEADAATAVINEIWQKRKSSYDQPDSLAFR